MKLSVIIVNYNVRYFLEQALLSVRKAARRVETEVWVVDNNSVDSSVAVVREKFPEVKLIANAHNPGFSIANNQAIRQASGEYILLLNPDTVVEEDTFEKCVAFMDAHPEAGGLGVRMIDGSGNFLPESKRGFPSPWVAFCKAVGLSSLFPASRLFNHYHLGYLSPDQTHRIEVLSGAFMLMRRSVLDEVGLLDESFFMYGEDIDLSYRIVKAGYANYYLPDTSIIHYKGESTKKGSLNYVKAFYQAMIIFARKHFQGEQAWLFILMLQLAIYFQASLTLLANTVKRLLMPLADALILYSGLVFLKHFWAGYHFQDPNYYSDGILYLNFPLYVGIWLGAVFFSGGYDQPFLLRRLVGGLLFGSLLLAAVYGFLDLEYRSSRALIVLGSIWAVAATSAVRIIVHFIRYQNFSLGRERLRNLVIVGGEAETERVLQLLQKAAVQKNLIGRIGLHSDEPDQLGHLDQLEEAIRIYRVDEVIFCSKDVSAQAIMYWMSRLGPRLLYKILPEESLSIIGSHSKNSSGELYTIDIQFQLSQSQHRRNKRLLEVLLSLGLLLSYPLQCLIICKPTGLWRHIWQVLAGHRAWVGYAQPIGEGLPPLASGVLSPLDALRISTPDANTIQRINFFYAKDYEIAQDIEIIWKGYRQLGG